MTNALTDIGFVGLGNMGFPMVRQLLNGGLSVSGYDTLPKNLDRAAALGLTPTDNLAALAASSRTIILMLPNSTIVEAVVTELLSAPQREFSTIVDMSSSVPAQTRELAERLAGAGVQLVDAPVSGGVLRANDGTLTIMVGGDADTVEKVRPILEHIGGAVHYAGPVGTGHAVKALNNLLSATHLLVSNTAALAATQLGIAPQAFLDIINASSGRSGSTELKLPRFVATGTFDSGFSADLLEKDLGIALGVLDDLGLASPVTQGARTEWAELNRSLERGADHTAIIQPVEDRLGTAFRTADQHATQSA